MLKIEPAVAEEICAGAGGERKIRISIRGDVSTLAPVSLSKQRL